MVGLLSGSMNMDFPLCLPIREPVLTQASSAAFLNIKLSHASIHGIVSTTRKLFQTLNTII